MEDVTNSPEDWEKFWEDFKDIKKLPCNDLRYVPSTLSQEEIEMRKFIQDNPIPKRY